MKYCIVISGRWSGRRHFGMPEHCGLPVGGELVAGEPAALLASGAMLPPLPPPDTEDQVYEWDAAELYHAPKLTKLGQDKQTIRQEAARLATLEAGSLRAMREAMLLLLTPEQKATAPGKALKAIEDEAADTRARLPKITRPETTK